MPKIKQAAAEFLATKRIAVTGVSGNPKGGHGSNIVYQRLRQRGYEVFAVNPNADTVEGDRCYHDLHSIPGGVEAVVIGADAAGDPFMMRRQLRNLKRRAERLASARRSAAADAAGQEQMAADPSVVPPKRGRTAVLEARCVVGLPPSARRGPSPTPDRPGGLTGEGRAALAPLGAGGWFVKLNGRIWEATHALWQRRRPLDLYHTALVVQIPEGRFGI